MENEGELSSLAKSGGGKRNSGKGAPRPSLLTSLSQSLLDDSLEFAKRFNADINFVHAKFAARKPLGLREGVKKNVDENEISPKCGWLGWLNPKQGPNPSKKKNPFENRLFRPEFHLLFSQISQKTWDGWVGKQIYLSRSPKKKRFFTPSL